MEVDFSREIFFSPHNYKTVIVWFFYIKGKYFYDIKNAPRGSRCGVIRGFCRNVCALAGLEGGGYPAKLGWVIEKEGEKL